MKKIKITDELLAAFTEGNVNAEETMAVIHAAKADPNIKKIIELSFKIDEDLAKNESETNAKVLPLQQVKQLPMESLAATSANNDCVIACEQYILKQREGSVGTEELEQVAIHHGWLKEGGTALYNIGRLLEEAKYSVARRYDCSIDDLIHELQAGCSVIVALDGNELIGNYIQEKIKDSTVGRTANHAVVILDVNEDGGYVELYDPDSKETSNKYSISKFMDAWDDSQYYMVSVTERGKRPYSPHPHDINSVKLPDSLNELTEAIAENAHEVWAEKRQKEGWTYGPERNDKLKQTPDLIPYCELTDSEKEYDRVSAMNSIKLLYRLGYEVVKTSH